MTPDALRNRARAWLEENRDTPLAHQSNTLTAEFLAIRNETIEEAAKECEPADPECSCMSCLTRQGCGLRIRALSTAGRTKP